MTYPYIGEDKDNGNITLFTGENKGVVVKNKAFELGSCSNHWAEYVFKNITTEYLANTYGEVKSKEHAEFIVKLAEVNGFQIFGLVNIKSAKSFKFKGGHLLILAHEIKDTDGLKQITIPLPPECESVDEWPVVGSSVEWGHTGKGEVKSLSDGFAWIKLDNKDYTTVYVSSLRKPKTPEQELRDEISDLAFNQFNDDSYDLTHNSYYLAEQLISKYNITKKGKGDE